MKENQFNIYNYEKKLMSEDTFPNLIEIAASHCYFRMLFLDVVHHVPSFYKGCCCRVYEPIIFIPFNPTVDDVLYTIYHIPNNYLPYALFDECLNIISDSLPLAVQAYSQACLV